MSLIKTQAIVFGKILKRKRIIKLGTTILPIKEDVKYLGDILNQVVYFTKYMHTFLDKVKAQFNKILTLENKQYDIRLGKFYIIMPYF